MVAAFGANNVAPRSWTAAEVALVRDCGANAPGTPSSVPCRSGAPRAATAAPRRARSIGRRLLDLGRRDQPCRLGRTIPSALRLPTRSTGDVRRLGSRACTTTTVRGCSRCARRCGRRKRRIPGRPRSGSCAPTERWRGSRAGDASTAAADGNVTRLTGLDLDFNQHRQSELALQARRDEEHDRALRTLLERPRRGSCRWTSAASS
jgi:hypothetical protein